MLAEDVFARDAWRCAPKSAATNSIVQVHCKIRIKRSLRREAWCKIVSFTFLVQRMATRSLDRMGPRKRQTAEKPRAEPATCEPGGSTLSLDIFFIRRPVPWHAPPSAPYAIGILYTLYRIKPYAYRESETPVPVARGPDRHRPSPSAASGSLSALSRAAARTSTADDLTTHTSTVPARGGVVSVSYRLAAGSRLPVTQKANAFVTTRLEA